MANLDSGTVAVFLSVLESEHGTSYGYLGPVIDMLEAITGVS
jgi:hypothetical protein